jgi:hypothetical protein
MSQQQCTIMRLALIDHINRKNCKNFIDYSPIRETFFVEL